MNITQRLCGACGHAYRVRLETDGFGGLIEDPDSCPHCEREERQVSDDQMVSCPHCEYEGKPHGLKIHIARAHKNGDTPEPVRDEPKVVFSKVDGALSRLADEAEHEVDEPDQHPIEQTPAPDLGPQVTALYLVPGAGGGFELVVCDAKGPAFTLAASADLEVVDRRPA